MQSKISLLFSFALLLSTSLGGCNCGETPPDVDANITRRDAGRIDSQGLDAASGQDNTVGTDSASDEDANTGNDAATGSDSAVTTDATGSDDASEEQDATGSDDASGEQDAASGSDAASSCPSVGACAQQGATRCDGNAVQTCEAQDGCLLWSDAVGCVDGESCSNGQCSSACTPECSQTGVRHCADANSVEICGQFDTDTCLDWGGATACPDSAPICSNGLCAAACSPECSVAGAKRCAGNSVEQCGDLDGDGCLNWVVIKSCPSTETCSSGVCADRCSDECSVVGERNCAGDGYMICDNHDTDTCLDWGSVMACPSGSSCSNGYCTQDCTEECTSVGETSCQGDAVRSCGQFDSDSCLEWGTAVACDDGQTCSNGQCAGTCQNECDQANVNRCAGDGTQTCGNYDSDPCLEWSGISPCNDGSSCSGGLCTTGCTDDCAEGDRECVGTSGYRVCGTNFDSDACWDWGPGVACASGETCNPNTTQCESGCVDACSTSTPLTCNDGINTLSCVEGNSGCAEWSTNPCGDGQACIGTACASCNADAFEPNNTADFAFTIMTLNGTTFENNSLTLCQPDEDFFRYQASAGQNILINLSFQHAQGDLDLEVFSPTGNLVATGWTTTDNERAVINNTLPGDYIIRVFGYDYGRVYGDSNTYGLRLSTVSCTDKCYVENLRTCTDSNSIGTCADINGDGCLEPETVTQPCGDGTSCKDGQCVACSDACTLSDEVCYHANHFNCVMPAGYSCTFWQHSNECAATEMCNPDATQCQACAADAEEPNNTFGTATALNQYGSIDNKTICTGDMDFYRIAVQPGHSIEARVLYENLSGFDSAELSVMIYKADQSLYLRTVSGSDVPILYSNEGAVAEEVFVEVASAYAGENMPLSTNTYTLQLADRSCQNSCDQTVAFRCTDDAQLQACEDSNGDGCVEWGSIQTCDNYFQVSGFACQDDGCKWICSADAYDTSTPNDDAGHATAMIVGNTASNLSICTGDADWFKVQVPAGNSVRFPIKVTTGDLQLYVATAAGDVLGFDPDSNVDKSVVLSNPGSTPQEMYVVVFGQDGAQGNYNILTIEQANCLNECSWVGYLDCQNASTQAACLADVDSDFCYEWDSNYGGACPEPTSACSTDYGCIYPCTADSFDSISPNNNDWLNSGDINDGVTQNLTLCAGDVDFYRIPAVALGSSVTITANISTSLSAGDLDLILYDAQGVFVGQAATTHSTEQIVLQARKAGDYFLRVSLHTGTLAAYSLSIARSAQ